MVTTASGSACSCVEECLPLLSCAFLTAAIDVLYYRTSLIFLSCEIAFNVARVFRIENKEQEGRHPTKNESSTKDDLDLSQALVGAYLLHQARLLGAVQASCGPRCSTVYFLEGRDCRYSSVLGDADETG